jgi:hypothetical protein
MWRRRALSQTNNYSAMATYDTSHIIQYVDDELSADERRAFEAELERDPALAAETARYRELRSVLAERLREDPGADALKATLGDMRGRYFGGASGVGGAKVRPMLRYVIGIAASVVLIVAGWWLFGGNGPSLQELGRTEMVTSVERGGQSDSIVQKAAERFNAGQFELALPLLDQAVKADSGSQLAQFYRGVTLWQLGRLAQARVDLQKVYSSGSLLQYEAAFYLALSYAKEKNPAAALDWLSRIPDDAPIVAKARELRKMLQPAR